MRRLVLCFLLGLRPRYRLNTSGDVCSSCPRVPRATSRDGLVGDGISEIQRKLNFEVEDRERRIGCGEKKNLDKKGRSRRRGV